MVTGENIPMWCPPTPPRLENDVYVDQSMCFLYDSAIMTESQLPTIYMKKERKRPKESHQSGHLPKKKARVSEEQPQPTLALSSRPPRSLFDRGNASMLKLRRDKAMLRPPGLSAAPMKLGSGGFSKPTQSDTGHQDQPEWLIHEDWSLLQAVQTLLQLPLNLTVLSPAHIPNWDLVSDIVSTTSRIYRSPKQCRLRYENVIIPREEGKLTYEANPRKQQSKKIPKSVMYKTKGNKPMKTGQLYTQDNGSSVTTLHAFRFDCIKNVASKRTPTLRPTLMNSSNRNSQHASVVVESGINYDSPLNPEEVAKIRQDRIRHEKNKQAVEQQQRASQTARAVTQGVQHLTPSGATAIISPAAKSALQASGVSIARTLPGSIVVNTPANTSFSGINKRLTTQSSTSVITGVTQVTQLSAGSRKMTVQEMQQLARGNTIMQRVQGTAGSASTGAPRTITVQQQALTKSLTPNQLNQLNMIKQQQQRAAAAAGGTTLVAQRATAAATSQLLSGQTVMTSGVPTLVKTVNSGAAGSSTVTLPVSGPVNINVSLAQQKALSAAQQGKTTLTANQQFRQIQLLHTGSKARPLTAHQKIGLAQHQLVGKAQGGSVQIVQQKIGGGGVQQKLGMQQIQHLIKQQQAQQAQIITAPSAAAGSGSGGQTIIATTQLITPANMHATITKMATPTTNAVTGAVSNVTVSLSRNLVTTSAGSVAIVPSSGTASLVQSPSKVVATSGPRQQAAAIAHRISGGVPISSTGSAAGGTPTSVVNLASVSLQNQPSVSASIINKGLTVGNIQTIHQVGSSAGTTILHARTPITTQQATVLQQTIISSKTTPAQSSTASTTVTLVPTTHSPAVVQIASSAPVITVDSTPPPASTCSIASITLPTTPIVSATSSAVAAAAVVTSTPTPTTTPSVAANVDLQTTTSAESSNESLGATPDPTRTYAMRPRKTN